MASFLEELREQRWDDHRYYHHSRINQSLHLLSATCFITCYLLLFINPGLAALLGWIVPSRVGPGRVGPGPFPPFPVAAEAAVRRRVAMTGPWRKR